ncbi:MAG: heparinase, partial [Spirochaetia bacterium]|nr:heparinase [Spirochaetia bacterium]
MKSILMIALLSGAAWLSAGETPLVLPNAGFEEQLSGWSLGATDKQNGISTPQGEAAHSGKYGLLIQDGFTNLGSYVTSSRFKIKPGCRYRYAFWGK